MSKTVLIFTAIPNPSETSEGLRLSVLVSPRLLSPPIAGLTLRDFQLGDAPWPKRVESMQLGVRFNDGPLLPAELASPMRPVESRSAALWQALFTPDTPVVPFDFADQRGRLLRSFPASRLAARLLDLYREIAETSPDQFPPLNPGAPEPSRLDRFLNDTASLPLLIDELEFPDEPKPPQKPRNPPDLTRVRPELRDHYDALRFYTRRPPRLVDRNEPPFPDLEPPELDFHQMVAALADHPTLLRKLGLVFDVLVRGVSIASVPTTGIVHLYAEWRGSHVDDHFSATRYYTPSGRFYAMPEDLTFCDGGYLRLDRTDRFPVLQVDIDGAALKVIDFAFSARRALTDRQQPPIENTSLPALRTGGFTLTQTERTRWLERRISRSAELNAIMGADVLLAEDVLRGYRIDVEIKSQWYSLSRRWGSIQVANLSPVVIPVAQEEEGYTKAASATSNEVAKDLYLHEAIAGWDGYSLTARHPGRSIVYNDAGIVHDEVRDVENTPGPGLDIQAEYQATPRSLPKLRYGQSYRFRARLVDLTGAGLPHTATDDYAASPPIAYQRFEPVSSPTFVLRYELTEAESVECLVIRSAPGMTPEAYVATPFVRSAHYPTACERHMLPPKTSLATAEAHGMFDPAFTSRKLAETYYKVAIKEAGSLLDRTIVDIHDGTSKPVHRIALHPAIPSWPRSGDPLQPGQYVTHGGNEVLIPYLPDPLAVGLTLFTPPDAGPVTSPLARVERMYEARPGPTAELAKWPDKRSVRLILRAAKGDQLVLNAPDSDAQRIFVDVPQGHRVTLRCSSLLDPTRLSEMAVWNLMSPASQMDHDKLVRQGRHWMLTPYREIMLVHAVQRPVTPPVLVTSIQRPAPGATFALFQGHIECHGQSTSHIDVRAHWVDPIDLPAEPRPRLDVKQGEAFRVPVEYGAPSVATTQGTKIEDRFPALSMANIEYLERKPHFNERLGQHELGDTRHHVITYRPVGTTRYAEHFPADVVADPRNLESAGPEEIVRVKASTRPALPEVLYIVPTFAWENGPSGERIRRGGGVRIYFERPWYSTGRGERLGILLAPYPADYGPGLEPFISLWGADPLWTAPRPQALREESFLGRDEKTRWTPVLPDEDEVPRFLKAERLRVSDSGKQEGVPDAPQPAPIVQEVNVLGVVPAYNEERGLWYCDIEFDTENGYFPFLRLALARYQPDALTDDLALSNVVRAEFIQLAPDRTATVIITSSDVAVRLVGVSAGNWLESTVPSSAHRVRCHFERRDGGDAAGDLAWRPVSEPVELLAAWANEANAEVLWSRTFPLPPPGQGVEYRIVLVESEVYIADAGQAERVTYVDMIPIHR